jgi:branched-chain amino acid transport system permease protein
VEFTLADAAVNAVIVALLGLGYTMILRSERFPHLWLVNFVSVGAYTSFMFSELWGASPYLGLPAGFLVGGVLGLACYMLVYRRLRAMDVGPVYMTLMSLGLGILVETGVSVLAYWLIERYSLYTIGFSLRKKDFMLYGINGAIWITSLLGLIVAVSTVQALRGKLGIVWRAFTEDPSLLQVCGCDPGKVRAASWFIAHGLAASLGSLYSIYYQGYPSMGHIHLSAMALASILGGESLMGSLLAGVGLGGFTSLFFGSIGLIYGDFFYALKFAAQPVIIWVALWFKKQIDEFWESWA